jgi:cytochrome c553
MKSLAFLAIALVFTQSFAQDLVNGEKVWKKINCASCHKKDGMGLAKDATKIRAAMGTQIKDLKEEYIVAQVIAIQSGTRKAPTTTTMMQRTKPLSAQDIKDVAHYITKKISTAPGSYKGMKE